MNTWIRPWTRPHRSPYSSLLRNLKMRSLVVTKLSLRYLAVCWSGESSFSNNFPSEYKSLRWLASPHNCSGLAQSGVPAVRHVSVIFVSIDRPKSVITRVFRSQWPLSFVWSKIFAGFISKWAMSALWMAVSPSIIPFAKRKRSGWIAKELPIRLFK